MVQISDIGADADTEMTVLCGMRYFFVGSNNMTHFSGAVIVV